MRMKKFLLSLAAVMAIAFTANAKDVKTAPNAWDGTTVADGVYTFGGSYNGSATWLGSEETPFDASANDYAYIKVSGVTGGPIRFAVQYNKFVAEQSWGKEFKQEIVLMEADGIYSIKLDKKGLGDGGKTLAEEILQLVVQDNGKAGSLKVEELGFCTKEELVEMGGTVEPDPADAPNPTKVGLYYKSNGGDKEGQVIESVDGTITVISYAGAKQDYDAQLWIGFDLALVTGKEIEVSFEYKASAAQKVGTQTHAEPGNYKHYVAIGDVEFGTEWKTFNKTVTVDKSMDGLQSIAFNLSANKTEEITFEIKNVAIKVDGNALGLTNVSVASEEEIAYDLFGNPGATEGLMVKGGKKVYVK